MSDPKHAAIEEKERRRLVPRAETVIAGLVVVMCGGMALLAVQYVSMHQDLETANAARDALASQVQHLGASPVAGAPGSRGEPGQSIVGPRGPAGPSGASGKPAPTITGPPGASGRPGADSTVAGPSGAPGPSSTVPGPSGPPGEKGDKGDPGDAGAPGQPPAGWSYSWTDGTGVTHHVSCTRTADSPDSAPEYACSDTSTDGPSPSPSGPLVPQGALLVAAAVVGGRRRGGPGGRGRHRAARGGAHR